jgi:hypothetical protein
MSINKEREFSFQKSLVDNNLQGHTVVGLEGTPFVAEQVFQDANLEYSKSYSAEIEGFVFKVIIIIS